MGENSLSLSQKLALLPASVPDCILDFLEDFKNKKPFTEAAAVAAIKPEYWQRKQNEIQAAVGQLRELGTLTEVTAIPLPRQYPGGCICKLKFSSGSERGIGFIVSQGTGRTGTISIIYFHEGDYAEAAIREKLTGHYRAPTKSAPGA